MGWNRSTTWLWVGVLAMWAGIAPAEEPYRQFLKVLKSEGLFDLAIFYLEDLQANPHIDPAFVQEIPLERANLLHESAAGMPRGLARGKRMDEAEKAFTSFLQQHQEHLRRGEARLGLGNLLLARAEELKAEGAAAANPEAARLYDQAQQVFASTQAELKAVLQPMLGARIDPADEAKKELRSKLQADYRRAELLSAFSTEHRGRSHAPESAQWKRDLELAQKAYTDFYTHEREREEARNIALFYRSGIQRDLGKIDDAADGYMRILGIDGIDELRALQFKSLTELIKLWTAKDQDKFAATVELIERWLKLIRPDERNSQDVIDFQMAAVKAKLEYAQVLQAKDKDDRNVGRLRKDVREELRRITAISGPHQKAARQLMGELGMNREKSDAPVELPKVTSYEQAVKEAESRFDAWQSELITQETLQQSLDQETDPEKKNPLQAQLEATNSTVAMLEEQTAELYGLAIRMFARGGDLRELNQTRYRLAYIQLQRGHPWAAIAIGEFLAQQLAGTSTGLQAATISLAGYRELIRAADEPTRMQVGLQLQPFAEFMVATWPDAKETQSATAILVQLAMSAGNIELARSYLAKLPNETGSAGELRRDIGVRLACEFLQADSQKDPTDPPAPERLAKRDSALELLTEGLRDIKKEQIDARAVEAINVLVRLQLTAGNVEEAAKWMGNPDTAPIALMRANPALVDNRLIKLNSYRTALQFSITQLASGAESSGSLAEIESLVAEMKTAAGEDGEGAKLLIGIFVSLAQDLQELLTSSNSNDLRQKLAQGLILVCKQVATNSQEYSTKFWAGSLLSNVAGQLAPSASQARQALQRESANILEAILAKGAQVPGWIPAPTGELAVRAALAQGLRNSGQYEEAIEQLTQVLAQKEGVLDFQVEAAEAFTGWAQSGDKDKFDKAINGLASSKIWGWKGISSRLQRSIADPAKAEPFLQARYRLSQTLMLQATADPARKTELLELAAREIGSTRYLKKDLGGPDWFAKFDALMKSIQKELGKPTVGLAPAKKD